MPINEVAKVIINIENSLSKAGIYTRNMIAHLIYPNNSCFEALIEEISLTDMSFDGSGNGSCKLYTLGYRERTKNSLNITEGVISFETFIDSTKKEYRERTKDSLNIIEGDISFDFFGHSTKKEFINKDKVRYIIDAMKFNIIIEVYDEVYNKINEIHSNVLSKDIAMKFYKEIPLPEEYKKYM